MKANLNKKQVEKSHAVLNAILVDFPHRRLHTPVLEAMTLNNDQKQMIMLLN